MMHFFLRTLIIMVSFYAPITLCRKVHRTKDPTKPSVYVSWKGDSSVYSITNYYLEEYPIFKLFDEPFFNKNLLPETPISYRNNAQQSITGKQLSSLINHLLEEIKNKKKRYTHFTILQNKGFNRRKGWGLIIVKFKHYPFVVKLFIETPESFVNPWVKGIEPVFFFYMGGGINRHLSGFTRLKNLNYINKRIACDPTWSNLVSTPRKWFWLPENNNDTCLELTGTNIGKRGHYHTYIPGTYAIVADAIEQERSFSIMNKEDLTTALKITNFLESNLDLHINNFMIEKTTKKIVIIDTEHFPSMVGLKEVPTFDSYVSWYGYLIGKCIKDMVFSTKKDRLLAQQTNVSSLAPFVAIEQENLHDPVHTVPLY